MLNSLNLFPYTSFFRINGNQELYHNCGLIASIIIIVILLLILIFQFIDVFSKSTIIFTTETSVALEPPLTTVSTSQDDKNYRPYMLALEPTSYTGINCPSSSASMNFYVQHITSEGGYRNASKVITKDNIGLQHCTSNHFSILPEVADKQDQWGYSSWWCLPLNKQYELGGSELLSYLYKQLRVTIQCSSSCDSKDCGVMNVYQLGSLINANNASKPFEYFLSKSSVQVKNTSTLIYASELDEHILTTDDSVLPWSSLSSKTGFSHQPIELQIQGSQSSSFVSVLNIRRSPSTTQVSRSYLTLLDALSYTGGFFPVLLAIFFFVNIFGQYYYEMKFAQDHFKSQQAKHNSFFDFIKEGLYALCHCCCDLETWDIPKKQNLLSESINKFLDFSYLYNRIDFLEKATSVMLEKHQMIGIHLIRSTDIDENDLKLKHHRLRDRLITFLIRHKTKERYLDSSNGKLSRDQGKKEQRTYELKEVILDETKKNENKQKDSLIKQSNDSHLRIHYEGEEESKHKQNEKLLEQQLHKISQLQSQILDEPELYHQLKSDLKQLVDEAHSQFGDDRSKRIYKYIDRSLRGQLLRIVEELKNHDKIL